MHAVFGYLSLIVALVSWLLYTYSVVRGYTKPHIFTWSIYAIISVLVFWIQYTAGGGAGSWAIGATAIGCAITTLLCLKYGTTDITRSDKIAFSTAIPTIVIWYITDMPFLTLLLILLAEALAFYSTVRKSYHRPHEEALTPYALSSLKLLFAAFAAEAHNFYTLAYPLYYVVVYPAFIVMVLWRRHITKTPKNPPAPPQPMTV